MSNPIKKTLSALMILIACVGLTSCRTPFHFINYNYFNTPRYSSTAFAEYQGTYRETIKVVSYNIKHSKKIKKAIELFQNNEELAGADIVLLQEMTPRAVEQIATELGYGYIFYPAVMHPILRENFGNAVLSKWPIQYDQNIIFPPIKEKHRHRVAVAARLLINDKKVLVYSLHMGVFMKPYQRSERIQGILDKIPKDINYAIVAGDFNTITQKNQDEVIETFLEADFQHATNNVDWTYKHWYLFNRKATFDHIFSKGMTKIRSGKIDDRGPSDHLPVWAEFSL